MHSPSHSPPLGASDGGPHGSSLLADPDGPDHARDPVVALEAASLLSRSSGSGVDGAAHSHGQNNWLQRSSLQSAGVSVYYSVDPLSNLRLRVSLRRQPDDGSEHAQNPRTFKQLALQRKHAQRQEEQRKIVEDVSKHARGGGGIDEHDDDPHYVAPLDTSRGRLLSSPSTAPAFAASVVSTSLFAWQQKVCSGAELLLFAAGSPGSKPYAHEASALLSSSYGQYPDATIAAQHAVAEQRGGMMLSTKRDHDRYVNPDDLHKRVSTSSSTSLNPLAHAIAMAPLAVQRSKSHITREDGVIPFHVIATVDLPDVYTDVKLVHSNSNSESGSGHANPPRVARSFEIPLCSIKAREGDEYVTLEMRPAFSPAQKDPTMFQDAEWYSFHSPAGEHYRYRIENYSAAIEHSAPSFSSDSSDGADAEGQPGYLAVSSSSLAAELLRLSMHNMHSAISRSGLDFDAGPPGKNFERLHFLGEILKAEGFDEENLCVSYELDMRRQHEVDYGGNNHDARAERASAWSCASQPSHAHGGSGNPMLTEAISPYSRALYADSPINGEPPVKTSYFGFPFEFALERATSHARGSNNNSASLVPSMDPIVYFLVSSLNFWGMSCAVGYGFCHLPLDPGTHERELTLWVPSGNVQDRRDKFFLGAGPMLRDMKLCGVTNDKSVLNRYGWHCISTGRLHIRIDVVRIVAQSTSDDNTSSSSSSLGASTSANPNRQNRTGEAIANIRQDYIANNNNNNNSDRSNRDRSGDNTSRSMRSNDDGLTPRVGFQQRLQQQQQQ